MTEMIKSEPPSNTDIPISMPDISPPCAAESDANTSGAPPPKASKVTPAKLSDNLKLDEIS